MQPICNILKWYSPSDRFCTFFLIYIYTLSYIYLSNLEHYNQNSTLLNAGMHTCQYQRLCIHISLVCNAEKICLTTCFLCHFRADLQILLCQLIWRRQFSFALLLRKYLKKLWLKVCLLLSHHFISSPLFLNIIHIMLLIGISVNTNMREMRVCRAFCIFSGLRKIAVKWIWLPFVSLLALTSIMFSLLYNTKRLLAF